MPIFFENYNPQNFEEAVDILFSTLDEDDASYIRESGTSGLHLWFGMAMRNAWGLWHNSDLAVSMKDQFGLKHADDLSGLILAGLEQRVNGEPLDVSEEVEHYKKHWINMGIDPLTQEPL